MWSPMHPPTCSVPSNRALLFSAAVKLLKFAMGCESCTTHNDAEEALWCAMHPLLCNPDEHDLATIGSLVLALLEGRTDLRVSGVFGSSAHEREERERERQREKEERERERERGREGGEREQRERGERERRERGERERERERT